MRRHVFIGQILTTSIVVCFACIVQTVSAQTYELKEVEVNGDTMYVSTDTSVYNQKPYTLMKFYYNNDTSAMGHSMYRYKYWEGAEQELFRLANSFFEVVLDDIKRKENDSISYYWHFMIPMNRDA